MANNTHDAIIIGGGHNGLVTAAYLAKTGYKVLVLERREIVGGCCITEELWPGFKVSTAAYVNSLLRPEIIKDLELKKYGFEMLPRSPSSFTPFPDGRYLMMGPDKEMTHREIAKFSKRDADAYPKYEDMLTRVADFLEPMLTQTPPDPFGGVGSLWKLGQLGMGFRRLGRTTATEAVEILTGAARPILDRWFESEELKATIATDAVIGAYAPPSHPGTAYVLFHHVMGECNGVRGVWGYVRGGMGTISNSIASAAKSYGAEIRTNAEVGKILVNNGVVQGVALKDGTEFRARRVASCADANVTFLKLMDPKDLPAEFTAQVKKIDYSSATVKINVALDRPPNWKALPSDGKVGPQHHGTMHICPDQDYIERAFDDAKYGRWSQNPMLECTMATALDSTLAPEGKHILSMFVQYAPYHLKGTTWDAEKDKFADRCFDILEEYAPGFKSSVLHRIVIPPPDMERMWGITGGNIMQGAMSLSSMFSFRPAAGYANYRTPVKGLYLCGAAAHPGGGVMGACGLNAAREMLKDR
ncbi:Phytoene desaturase (lycopene-forming) [Gemmata obscuriglobus]|uniref:Pyridine nucleotide-disulfide oxidoreductase domain-containing protein 2 n=1 Tax=Gemmata obscuriglobus TaxID=114 RepID=A0A2Z3GW71_9BACT|nr:NAD(P)/FAD-dependent oxidoreductase [Gemmata obscuriglobus]AWM37983.1 NAD(P)/FAD-dependent oxidoreductase [Gemmata obscuriglobus]QEG29156.1 Phytoene desaturase (lycopene-forming) [Gemmata obscuriglobus]VTS07887.1 amine oxidase : Phytoene dehydrogenase-related protein OS=Blastopirellula marina DSM 3645 GN=DSM3645_00225 PE=4 SV=1: DAO [Gemmata obscuriglobus UQM 2246]